MSLLDLLFTILAVGGGTGVFLLALHRVLNSVFEPQPKAADEDD